MKDNSPYNITLTSGAIIKAAVILVLFYLLYILRDLLLVLLTSVVIASAVEPFTGWLMRYRIPRVPAVISVYIVSFFVVTGLIFLFYPLVSQDFVGLIDSMPSLVKSFDFFDYIPDAPAQYMESIKTALLGGFSSMTLFSGFGDAFSNASRGVLETARIVFSGAFSLVLVLVFSFYLAVQEDGVANFLRLIAHVKHEEYIIGLWGRSRKKIGLWLQGQIFLGLLIGVFVYLGLAILGIRYALALAFLAAVAELIPIFGPILSAVPAVVLGFVDGPTLGFMVLGLYIIIQQFENHLIYPLVVRKIIGVPPLIVILALIIGARLAGFFGVLISVPLAAVFMELVNDIEKRKKFFTEHKGD